MDSEGFTEESILVLVKINWENLSIIMDVI